MAVNFYGTVTRRIPRKLTSKSRSVQIFPSLFPAVIPTGMRMQHGFLATVLQVLFGIKTHQSHCADCAHLKAGRVFYICACNHSGALASVILTPAMRPENKRKNNENE